MIFTARTAIGKERTKTIGLTFTVLEKNTHVRLDTLSRVTETEKNTQQSAESRV